MFFYRTKTSSSLSTTASGPLNDIEELSGNHYDEILIPAGSGHTPTIGIESEGTTSSVEPNDGGSEHKPDIKYDYAYSASAEKRHSNVTESHSYIEVIGDDETVVRKDGKNVRVLIIDLTREKGRDLTQSCDKNPYTHRIIQKAT